MPCTKFTSRCRGVFPCCHEHLLEILDFVHALFVENDIPHWLNFGTLLGAVRGQDLIPWDEDIDVGIWEKDVPKVISLIKYFLSGGYKLRVNHVGNGEIVSVPVFYSHVNSLHMCLNTFTVDGEFGCGVELPRMRYPLGCLQDLSTVVLHGKEYPCPRCPEYGLESYYGPDWRTPKIKTWIRKFIMEQNVIDPNLRDSIKGLEEYEFEPGREG